MDNKIERTSLLIRKSEAAALLGICARTLTKMIAEGNCPARKVHKCTMIPREWVIRFVEGTAPREN